MSDPEDDDLDPESCTRYDYIGLVPLDRATDLGAIVIILHRNGTLTRICKGCGSTLTTPTETDPLTGRVTATGIFAHTPTCPMPLPNNPLLS